MQSSSVVMAQNRWSLLLLFLVCCVGAAGYFGFTTGSKLKQAEWDATVLASKEGQEAALIAAAEAIAKIEVKSAKYIQPIRTEIQTNTVYRDCTHSPDSMRNINALITGQESGSSTSLP